MDLLVRKRAPVRGYFTRSYNILIEKLNADNPQEKEIKVLFANLERVYLSLAELDNEISNFLIENPDAGSYETEYAAIEEYNIKMTDAKVSVDMYLIQFSESERGSVGRISPQIKRKLKLPKIELVKFNGEIKNWLAFWSQFKRIHDDDKLENEDKFQYLIQSVCEGTRAREILDSYPPTNENYSKAIESLKSRFGKDELLIEFYVRELLKLVIINATESKRKLSTSQIYDKLETYLRALESIGLTSDKYSAMLFPLVESCIPEDIFRVWLRSPVVSASDDSSNNVYTVKLKNLLLFMKTEIEGEERIRLAKSGFTPKLCCEKKERISHSIPLATATDLFSGGKEKGRYNIKCLFCEKSHESKECYYAKKLDLEKKQEILRSKNVCFICLKPGHKSRICKSNVQCLLCNKRHWALLCPELPNNKTNVKTSDLEEKPNVSLSSHCTAEEVLLQTLQVNIKTEGKTRRVRALIDSGSQQSYLLKKTVKEMNLKPTKNKSIIHSVFGGSTLEKLDHGVYEITLQNLKNGFCYDIQVLDQPVICGKIPRLKEGICNKELKEKNITLTDHGKNCTDIELLIGADFCGQLFTGNMHVLNCGLVAYETKLGWLIMGKVHGEERENTSANLVTSLLIKNSSIADLWKLDILGIEDPIETKSKEEMERNAMDHFMRTVGRHDDGRYVIKLPWIRSVEELPSNRDIAAKRLSSTTTKLLKSNQFQSYDDVFTEWERENIIEASDDESPGHYLPHRGVFKVQSSTKVRPVFDASCKIKGSLSLNDCLMKGPNFLELIPSVLLKFREKKIGIVSDIKKAFLQISVEKEDRKFLKFLWWKDQKREEHIIYQHARVVFGLNCSPFLLNAVIHHHLNQYVSTSLEDVAMKLKNSFYVDNCVTSVESELERTEFIKDSAELMADAKFELRGWECSEETRNSEERKPTPVLGLLWNKSEDTLYCDFPFEMPPEIITRRVILSFANRIFDPIGFTCPVTLCPKLLLQESWQSNVSWDSEVSTDMKKKFLKWFESMKILHLVKVPRQAFLSNSSMSLHVFCDASGASYAAVVFIRCQTDLETTVQLLLAKSRIAPLKSISIPRLELLACLIGVRLSEFVKRSLNIGNIRTCFWTDSTTALQWIQKDEVWSVFIRNRVQEIRKSTSAEEWRHVPGSVNPADLPSRGCSVLKLLQSRWWEGPAWLLQDEDSWPKSAPAFDEEIVFKEKIKKSTVLLNSSLGMSHAFSYFSSYTKTLRMVGWMLRFLHNVRVTESNRKDGDLSLTEMNEAEKRIIRMIQSETFTEDSMKELKTLNIFRDVDGIYRIKTKLTESNDSEDFKFPVLLPGKHRLVELLIRETHLRNLHAGVQILLSMLREKYWIINGRRSVRREIHRCVRCKRYSSKRIETPPIGLPSDRVKEASVFEVTGVDLAGPLFLKGGEKCWIVLFTCGVYRAIHLELVLSLSAKAFLLCLRRFIARRGRPEIIYSDNGKNFVGSENLLESLDWSIIEQETSTQKITWKFIPPSAPWWGGFWERMVQMVKKILRRVLGNACVLYEEMLSILCDCEAIINSRPLTCLSEDPNDLIPLTPSMFLQAIPTVGVPDLDELDKIDVKRRWKHQQTLREHLRKRFRREYLGLLIQPREKNNYCEIKPGDIVLIENSSKKKLLWPMAKVIEVYPGKDKRVRVVQLKTSYGEILRPVRKIYPLEIRSPTVDGDQAEKEKDDTTSNVTKPATERSVTTKSGRVIKLPARFLDT